jgi:serine phosphatase RsbU (regulator of sigma subunit)
MDGAQSCMKGAEPAAGSFPADVSRLPAVPVRTSRPAGHGETIGGDWVDVFPLPDGRVGVVVGDVAGHGIEAAATMTRLRTMVHLLATSGVSPAGVMRRLNETLHDTELGDDIHLATLVHGQLDLATGALAVVLQPGSVLIGYTDGLIEHRGHDLDDNLLALLSGLNALPASITADVEALADAILAMSQPGPTTDDIAVIALAFDPRSDPVRTHDEDLQVSDPADALTAHHSRTIDLDDVALPPDRWA